MYWQRRYRFAFVSFKRELIFKLLVTMIFQLSICVGHANNQFVASIVYLCKIMYSTTRMFFKKLFAQISVLFIFTAGSCYIRARCEYNSIFEERRFSYVRFSLSRLKKLR